MGLEVSHNTAPLKSFAYVYQDLMATVTKSKFCIASPAKHSQLPQPTPFG